MICSAPSHTASSPRPMPSMLPGLRVLDVRRIFDETHDHQDGEDADRNVDVEGPAPRVCVGQPAAERWAEHRSDDDAQCEDSHARSRVYRAGNFPAGWPAREAAARRRRRPAQRARSGSCRRLVAAPQAKDETVKMTMQVMRKRLRPNFSENQALAGRTTALGRGRGRRRFGGGGIGRSRGGR